MCCFSRPVKFVTNTQIFARPEEDHHQVLAYAMRVGASEDLAMILPLPTPAHSPDDAVRFIDLSGYADFFDDLKKAFPVIFAPQSRGGGALDGPALRPALIVHRVGDFEASFVPNVKDFPRLDERFRLPESTWDKLPQYADWGFAVFKLRAGVSGIRGLASRFTGGRAFSKAYHPMAFRFPRRDASQVFFPTVHIHDGVVHEQARFAHELYVQGARPEGSAWIASECDLDERVDVKRSEGLIARGLPAHRRNLVGEQANEDTFVPIG